MKVIGFRASPKELCYSIVEGDRENFKVECSELIKIPLSLSFPEQLNYVRKTVKDVIDEYGVVRAGIRTTESSSQSLSIERISFEAILLELFSSSTIEKYLQGQISTMFSKLGIKKTDFKPLVETKQSEYKTLNLHPYNKQAREAILVAIAALNM
jgi:hypothetical protein